MTDYIKIYGERNSNTNYLSRLISLNLDVAELPGVVPSYIKKFQEKVPGNELIRDIYFRLTFNHLLGWKHSKVEIDTLCKSEQIFRQKDHRIYFVTLTKNPYSWLLSLYRNPYHQYDFTWENFTEFLTSSWKTVARDNTDKLLQNPMELWNIKNRSYLQLRGTNVVHLKSESLLENASQVIDTISRSFSINKSSEHFRNYDQSTKDSSKDTEYYKDYYLNERWRGKLSEKDITIINCFIDHTLMSHYGYKIM